METKFSKSKMVAFTVVALLFIAESTRPQEVWTWSFGGDGFEHCYSVKGTADGGYILGGWTDSYGAGNEDIFLVKVNGSFELEWQRTFGGHSDDYCESFLQTADGGFVLAGWTASYGEGSYDMFLLKIDSKGKRQWQRTYGGKFDDYCYAVYQSTDLGYVLAGTTRESFEAGSDVYLVKTDSRGKMEWEKTYGGPENDGCYSVQQTRDGGYVLAGDTRSSSNDTPDYDMYLVKTDSYGNMKWQRTFGGDYCDGCYSVKQTADGGYILAGDSESYGKGLFDVYLVKTNSKGKLEWEKTFGGPGWDDCYSVEQTSDGGFLLGGCSESFGLGNFEIYLVRTDAGGNLEWQRTFGGEKQQYAYSVLQAHDKEYILAGYSESMTPNGDDMLLVQVVEQNEILVGGKSLSIR